jgi:Na+/H+ antiporter NhaD/arsenite permease-like protein
MGFAAEYGEKPKVTEMDFFDFFFAYGILGSGIVLILFIKKIRDWLRVEKEQISEDKNMFIILIGVLMLLAIAFVAGHVFFAPSVSFYLAIGIVLLIKKKKEIVEIKS